MLKKPIFDLVQGIVPSVLIATSLNLQVSRTGIKSWASSNFGNIVLFVLRTCPRVQKSPLFDLVQGKGPSVLIASVLNLQVSRTGIKSWICSNFGLIVQLVLEPLALECCIMTKRKRILSSSPFAPASNSAIKDY